MLLYLSMLVMLVAACLLVWLIFTAIYYKILVDVIGGTIALFLVIWRMYYLIQLL